MAQESRSGQGEHGNENQDSEADTASHLYLINHKSHIIDLYAVGTRSDGQDNKLGTKPFVHQVQLLGPQGKIMHIWGLCDEGAMREAMSTKMFHKVKHRPGRIWPSSIILRMADGSLVKSLVTW
jgi:hypothetical protein